MSTPPTAPMTQSLGGMTQSLDGKGMSQSMPPPAPRPKPRMPTVNQPERPLLARVADSVYWMARYMERAEHVARLMSVHSHLLMDLGDLAPALLDRQWRDVLKIMHAPDVPGGDGPMGGRVARFCVFDTENPNSVVNCVGRARENARGVRSDISAEMWEAVNELYWTVRGGDGETLFNEQPEKFYDDVIRASMTFQGLTDQTLGHDQRWHFAQLGKSLERVDVTCRVIETRFSFLRENGHAMEGPIRNIVLMAALRMCCSIEAYRRQHFNDLDLLSVASFLILGGESPAQRAVRHRPGARGGPAHPRAHERAEQHGRRRRAGAGTAGRAAGIRRAAGDRGGGRAAVLATFARRRRGGGRGGAAAVLY